MGQRARNKKLYVAIQALLNTPATVLAANAVKTSGLDFQNYAGDRVSQEYDRAGLGNDRDINVNPYAAISAFRVPFIGSGDWATAPAWGVLLRACAAAQTDATTAVDTGTAEAGTGTTLQDTDKTWDADEHIGSVVTITGGTGDGQTRVITDNDTDSLTVSPAWDTNPDATSEYTITLGEWYYTPVDTGFEMVTAVVTEEHIQQQIAACRGSFGIEANPGTLPVFTFANWMGNYATPVVLALTDPDDSAYGDAIPVTYSNTAELTIDGVQYAIGGFTFDAGVTTTRVNQPGRLESIVEDRRASGTIICSPTDGAALVALLTKVENHNGATDVTIDLKHGTGIGSILKLNIDRASLGEYSRQVIAGETYFSFPFMVLPPRVDADEWRITQAVA